MLKRIVIIHVAWILFAALTPFACGEITRLTVDARPTPVVGIATPTPEFGWELIAPGFYDVEQRAYSLAVASSADKLDAPDCWAGDETVSTARAGVRYPAENVAPLEASKRYFWRVKVKWGGFDAQGNRSEKTETADGEFITGAFDPNGWDARWITAERTDADPAPLLFRDFELDQPKENVADAFLHVCGLGQQIVSVNSRRVGEATSIDPGWTNYRKTCLYTTYDVKKELTGLGSPSISIFLGNGMYNVPGGRYVKFIGSFGLPKAIARLVVRYRDGSTQTIVTDENWRAMPTPLVFTCVYGGDDVDEG
ncbi:MAG: alpha-L-rhamnosidase N-terminal domain-containing protein, partial [Thermoguttaceae bacterium]|nr:alpha-L-rhamnosidase N-terminal domain-containing protein [Thermoguttaceae bacterium]